MTTSKRISTLALAALILGTGLEAVNSAGLSCVQPGVENGVTRLGQAIQSFAMRVSINATR